MPRSAPARRAPTRREMACEAQLLLRPDVLQPARGDGRPSGAPFAVLRAGPSSSLRKLN